MKCSIRWFFPFGTLVFPSKFFLVFIISLVHYNFPCFFFLNVLVRKWTGKSTQNQKQTHLEIWKQNGKKSLKIQHNIQILIHYDCCLCNMERKPNQTKFWKH